MFMKCDRGRQAYCVMDGDTGELLVGGAHTVRRPIASLTKVDCLHCYLKLTEVPLLL